MRLLIKGFEDRLQYKENDSGCHWKDLVKSLIQERCPVFREEVVLGGRAARRQRELDIAGTIMATTNDRQERRRLWEVQTGKSEPALYRRMAELHLT
jgi:hypothetical protein